MAEWLKLENIRERIIGKGNQQTNTKDSHWNLWGEDNKECTWTKSSGNTTKVQ